MSNLLEKSSERAVSTEYRANLSTAISAKRAADTLDRIADLIELEQRQREFEERRKIERNRKTVEYGLIYALVMLAAYAALTNL